MAFSNWQKPSPQWSHGNGQVVEFQFFGGMEEHEIAEAFGVSESTVHRDWDEGACLAVLLSLPRVRPVNAALDQTIRFCTSADGARTRLGQ
jgi:hypothetical protein